MQLFYAIGVALWLSNLMLDLYMSPHGDRGPHIMAAAAARSSISTVAS